MTQKAPSVSHREITAFVRSQYGLELQHISELGGYVDQNLLLIDSDGNRYTCKVHDRSEHPAVLGMQNSVMQRLGEAVDTCLFPRPVRDRAGDWIGTLQSADGEPYLVRLLTYVPGRLLKEVNPVPDRLLEQVGQTLGCMDRALEGYYDPAANRPDIHWDLKNALASKPLCAAIADPYRRRLAEYFLLQFESEVLPELVQLRKSVVHNDAHRYSILVDETADELAGIFDFGDTVYTYTVTNIAICLSDLMLTGEDPIAVARVLVAAYHREFPLTEREIGLIYHLVCTRLTIYGCKAAEALIAQPDNKHAQLKAEEVWNLLDRLLATNPLALTNALLEACGFTVAAPDREVQQKLRDRHMGKSLGLHYREPLHLTQGALQYLYSAEGDAYLDCVNNVCQWGHCHPRIAGAIRSQVATLNTNSRYLYEQLPQYAQQLADCFPEPLSVCFLVNSGSEANDLAMRMAKAYTGHTEMLVIDKAYHGNSSVCTDISPHRIDRPGRPGLPEYVHKTLTPDTLRGPYKRDDPEAGYKYAADVQRIIEELAADGRGVAAFYAESQIGTGGQIVLPEGYLNTVYEHVRAAGGVCVADEVQLGFGRVGDHLWCFETQGVVPDIVTLGKPIGNGHPLGAVITTPEIAAAFNNGVPYFNTFGGNPVSCAAGLAVLDVLKDEEIMANCRTRGAELMEGLLQLAQRYECIADVRGQGLYIGVELVQDRDTMAPAAALAEAVVEMMKGQGILLNTNGYDNNIIKIKPPLIISAQNVQRIVGTLDRVLAALT
ncbi:aminotransferase class III-fold pyridoxal phosphate-dependent enzyme [Microbulbifer marinus]|uniref:Hydroxylysine kinase /5-phosphonooxy-L-lysine phospho-lyase apoenzyme n=1 Tax=Microbulbifer marinus TaxID=658218 RepID=A0A1H3WQB8_9GAMM|nr:aminotransferase class III-fold pyridoxal phosphate-dependent enzyme [Microbulbifer marinus]SDZ89329.1 hydroxylysine kinase /5-phosphonooxy-L-lysine phospho-lyase apoenzyme [Microbulbifer marinus]